LWQRPDGSIHYTPWGWFPARGWREDREIRRERRDGERERERYRESERQRERDREGDIESGRET